MQLMAIPGPSGQESQVSRFIADQLLAVGAPASAIRVDNANRRTIVPGDTGNLLLRLPGTLRGERRMLSAHMDTVPICVGARPVRNGNCVYSKDRTTGLGADNRAGCAVLLNAACEILARNLPHPPLTFCWFVQEEIGLQGSRTATRSLWGHPKLAFNWDGGAATKLTIGATGGCRISIDVTGVASHAGGAPEHGVSAIAIAAIAIADLHKSGWHGDIQKNGKHGTSNVGMIRGGAATNVVTDHVSLRAEARSHDPEFRQQILLEIEQAFERAAKQVRAVDGTCGKVRFESRTDYESFLLRGDEPCVLAAEAAIGALGLEATRVVANGGVDANWMTIHGVPTVTLGCGQRNQHTVSEALDLEEFGRACRIALKLATG
jgi:tripeptide aminopeptidase